jgi:pyruvate carboxylase
LKHTLKTPQIGAWCAEIIEAFNTLIKMMEHPLDPTKEYLFVYGTLKKSYGQAMHQRLAQEAIYCGEAYCVGRLYAIDWYPGLCLSDDSQELVWGELYHLPLPDHTLAWLDEYEGFDPKNPAGAEYVRQILAVWVGKTLLSAQTYVHQWPVEEERRIVSGRF